MERGPGDGAATPWIQGLTRATNVLELGGAIYALEVSTDLLAGAPGQLLRFDSPTATPAVVAGDSSARRGSRTIRIATS